MEGKIGPARGFGLGLLAGSLLACGTAAAALPVPATGANVDESRVQKTFFVDPAHPEAADDDKHGAPDAPLATLGFACQAAAKAKDANVGVKIILATGTYREAAKIGPPANGRADTEAPLVIEAAEREQAVIDGADTEGWSPSTWKVEDTRWTHPWPFRRNAVIHPAGLPARATGESYRRGDLVFVNGTPLRQVDAAADLAPGCLWGMLPASPGGRRGAAPAGAGSAEPVAVVRPPPDTELPGAIIQVGVRARGLTISGRRNVVVRGLLIEHAAEPDGAGERTAGLALEDCSNVLVEDVLSQWNDGAGLAILGRPGEPASTDFTLRRVRLLHNGGSGLTVSNVKNLLAEDNETSFNNFRGEWAGWIDPQGPAAVKVEGVRGSTWRRQHVIGNGCRGLWWTGGNTDVTVEDSAVQDNRLSGVASEDNPGPALVRRCLVAGTKRPPGEGGSGAADCAGVSLAGTPDVTLESNVLADNAGTQLALVDAPGKPSPRAERHVYRHNVVFSADADLYRMPASENPAKPRFAFYYGSLDSEENCFWNPVNSEAFQGYGYRGGGSRKAAAVYPSSAATLDDWRTGALREAGPPGPGVKIEAGSRWQDPLFVDPGEGDYRLKRSSPVADWNLPSDEAAAGQ